MRDTTVSFLFSMLSCLLAQQKLSSLKTLKHHFEVQYAIALKEGENSPLWLDVKKLKQELEQAMKDLSHDLNPFEEFHLEEQYESQLTILKEVGILKTLSTKEQGIESIPFHNAQGTETEQREYPVPSFEQILDWMKEKEDLLKEKHQQGFTKMLLVPFGLPLKTIASTYEQQLQYHSDHKSLFYPKTNTEDHDEPITTLHTDGPLYQWNQYHNADIGNTPQKQQKTDGLVYYPTQFTKNHKGYTKQELLSKPPPELHTLTEGWQILFVEDLTHIPRKDKGETTHNRPQLEAEQPPTEYLEKLQNKDPENPYHDEQGMIPEIWFMLALTNLHEKNEVTDDYGGNGSTCFLTGSYLPSAVFVPYACWDRGGARAGLGGFVAGGRWRGGGSRAVVGV